MTTPIEISDVNARCLTQTPARPRIVALSALAFAALLPGCAAFTPDAGLSTASAVARDELRKDVLKVSDEASALDAGTRVARLLRGPLTADGAVQVALLSNKGLQAAFNDLGVSEAAYVAATLPPVPRLSFSRIGGSLNLEVERQLLVSLFQLATLPARTAVAERRFRAAQYKAAEAVLRLAAETRREYYRTVAFNQRVGYLNQALDSAEAASSLVTALGETGALGKLEQGREHAFTTELGAQLARTRVEQRVEREKLTRLLGLWGKDINYRLPPTLPPLPKRLDPPQAVEALALAKRVDLEVARLELDALAKQYGLTSASRYVNAFEFGLTSNYERAKVIDAGLPSEAGGSPTPGLGEGVPGTPSLTKDVVRRRGHQIEFGIPIFDFGATNVVGAREGYLAAANRLAERAVNARSQAREAYQRYRGYYDLTRYYQARVLPLRKLIQDQAQLQYNGMLIDVAQLILDARARILSNTGAIEAQRDFWIAATDLKAAMVGGGFGGEAGGGEAASAAPAADGAAAD